MKTLTCLCVLFAAAALAPGQVQPQNADDPEIRRQLIAGAMAQLNVAKLTGDVEVVRAFVWCANDPDRKLADAQARSLIAKYAFYVAAVNRFGEQETARLRKQFDLDTPDSMMLLAVEWKVEGDKATPKDEGKFEVVLHRVNQIWRLDLTPDPAPAAVDVAARAIAQQAKAIQQVADDLKANKYSNVDELAGRLKKVVEAAPADK